MNIPPKKSYYVVDPDMSGFAGGAGAAGNAGTSSADDDVIDGDFREV